MRFPTQAVHSTETALYCSKNDILRSIDKKKVTVLVLLDLLVLVAL